MSRITLGVMLVIIGVFITLSNLGWLSGGWALIWMGGGFALLYILRGGPRRQGNLGLLIPGSILAMLGLHGVITTARNMGALGGSLFFFLLALAFLGVYLLHTRHQVDASAGSRQWPVITAVALFLFSLLVFSTEVQEWEMGRRLMPHLLAIALVITGMILLWRSRGGQP